MSFVDDAMNQRVKLNIVNWNKRKANRLTNWRKLIFQVSVGELLLSRMQYVPQPILNIHPIC